MPLQAGGNNEEDRQIRDAVIRAIGQFPWGRHSQITVIVRDGVLHLYGVVAFKEQADALRVAAQAVAGVRHVADHTVRLFGDMFETMRQSPPRVTVIGPAEAA